MLNPIIGYSLEPPPSEVDFIRRELGIEWRQGTARELAQRGRSGERQLLLVSEPNQYVELVNEARVRSFVVLLVSDEGYSRERLDLAKAPSVVRTYRHYPAARAGLSAVVRSGAGYVRDSLRTTPSPRTVVPNMRTGFRMRSRMADWEQLADRVRSVPLGYTDTFARAFSFRAGLDPETSLLEQPAPRRERPTFVTFQGNRGLAQRIAGLELADRFPGSHVVAIDAEWSARATSDVGSSYVDSLCDSRFALCPPGFTNNESFRFYESLICGALPLEVAVATTHLGSSSWRNGGGIVESSWTKALDVAAAMSENVRESRVAAARRLIVNEVLSVAAGIQADMEA